MTGQQHTGVLWIQVSGEEISKNSTVCSKTTTHYKFAILKM